jgi:hypothetical protein
MIDLEVPTIFESFNARSLKPAQVARTFVPSLQYQRLTQRRHSVLVGPRGSGKTTLLKMLQPQALEVWSHAQAPSFRSSIDFTGVFIPTDLTWREQIQALGGGKLDPDSLRLLSAATVTTHVLRSLAITIAYRCSTEEHGGAYAFRRVDLSGDLESEIVEYVSSAWELRLPVPSFLALKHALSLRLSRIQQLANQEASLSENGRVARLAQHGYLFLDLFHSASVGIERFDDAIDQGESRWALMFDELELAPDWLQSALISAMRSRDDRFIFKLALAPFSGGLPIMKDHLSPAPDQDFDPVCLWYAEKRSAYSFCVDLWYQILAERNLPRTDPKAALGRSYFETPSEEWRDGGTAYMPKKRLGRTIISAASKDSSFRRYLAANNIDPYRLQLLSGLERSATLRKIAPVIVVREFFRREGEGGKSVKRSRKSAALYTGADSLFAVSEGNPRWFISMIGRLLDHWDPERCAVTEAVQAGEMVHAAQRFAAMIGTIPTKNFSSVGSRGLLGLVEAIGEYFHARVTADEFTPEPPNTFVVDDKVSDGVARGLGQALNAGAIVYVPDDWSRLILDDLRAKRFRVSYLLAPIFGLPIRLGKEIVLSSIMQFGKERDAGDQMELI